MDQPAAQQPGVNTNTRLIVFQFSHLTEYPTISLSSSLSQWTVWTVSGHCTNNYRDCLDLQIYVETINIAIMLHGHVSSVGTQITITRELSCREKRHKTGRKRCFNLANIGLWDGQSSYYLDGEEETLKHLSGSSLVEFPLEIRSNSPQL